MMPDPDPTDALNPPSEPRPDSIPPIEPIDVRPLEPSPELSPEFGPELSAEPSRPSTPPPPSAEPTRRIATVWPALLLLAALLATLLLGPELIRELAFLRHTERVERVRAELLDDPELLKMSDRFAAVAKAVEPSVVHIEILGRTGFTGTNNAVANGSGWVYDDQGHVITNAHVVNGADAIQVRFANGDKFEAELIGMDTGTDIAVVRVPTTRLHPAVIATETVRQGEIVFAFGSPLQYAFSMSQGIVSGDSRRLGITGNNGYERFIQTDAAINPGNSGGPLTDAAGRVVGMNTAIAADPRRGRNGTGGFLGLGFAIPADLIINIADRIIADGKVTRGYLGVYIDDLAPRLAESFGFPGQGVLINELVPGGPAVAAGLEPGDIITHVNQAPTPDVQALRFLVGDLPPGETVNVTVYRNGETIELQVTLARMPNDDDLAASPRNPFEQDRRERDRDTDTEPDAALALSRELGLLETEPAVAQGEPGLAVLELERGSALVEAGILPGDIIITVADRPVDNVDSLEAALLASPDDRPIRLRIARPDRNAGWVTRFLAVDRP